MTFLDELWAIPRHSSTTTTGKRLAMTSAPCPDCDGDGATYEWARVGQHATPFVCLRCDGSGEATDPDIPIEEVEVHALREALAREIARANALQDALDKEREKAAPTPDTLAAEVRAAKGTP